MKGHELDNYSDRLHPSNVSNWQSLVDLEPDPNSTFTDEDSWVDWNDEDEILDSLFYSEKNRFYSESRE